MLCHDGGGVTQPTATRPLAIQKNGTWYTCGHDLTKNVTELYNTNGTIATAYDYTPFGQVTASGTAEQPIQWSSEFNDAELGLVYYNYRHYNPQDGRWINRDPAEEGASFNLYDFIRNAWSFDVLGLMPLMPPKKPTFSEIWPGSSVSVSGNAVVTVQDGGSLYSMTMPLSGKVTGKLSPMNTASPYTYTGAFTLDLKAKLNKGDEEKYPSLLEMMECCQLMDKTLDFYKSIELKFSAHWNIQSKDSQQFPAEMAVQFVNNKDNFKFNW